jgi:hypothetical protein
MTETRRWLSGPKLWFVLGALSSGLALALASCAPESSFSTTADYDVVRTQFVKGIDYSAFATFAMPDSVIHVRDEEDTSEVDRRFDDLMLEQVAKNMEAIGYREVYPDQEEPDILVVVRALSTLHVSVSPGYPWYPPGWGWGWWGPWYPYYPPYWNVSSFNTGTVLVDLWDVENSDPVEEEIAVLWFAAMNGLLESSTSNTEARIKEVIERAFAQSPYLGRSGD